MNKNSKFLFLGLTLLVLLVSVGAVSAVDSDNIQDSISDNTALSTSNDVSTNKVLEDTKKVETSKDVKKTSQKTENKNITKTTKTDKQPKKAVETTQTATDYETLKTSWNNIKNDGDDTTDYIINVKNGNYQFDEELEINTSSNINSITINGEDKDKTVFDAQNKTRHFNLNSTTIKVNFNNITFTGGFNDRGGSICSKAVVEINNSNFINNSVQGSYIYGGVLYLTGKTLINNSNFINNTAIGEKYVYGGVIRAENITQIYNSTFINNTVNSTSFRGCVLYLTSALTITDNVFDIVLCEFNNNIGKSEKVAQGGAVYNDGKARICFESCDFINNQAGQGGAIYFYDTWGKLPYNIIACVFENNTAPTGKNIHDPKGQVSLSNNYYPDNSGSSSINVIATDGRKSGKVFNQNTKMITITCINTNDDNYGTILSLGRGGLTLQVNSSSDLINTTGKLLTPENNYTVLVDLSSLPENYENITFSVDGTTAATITWDYSNVEFNNVTAKPGSTIQLNATFKTKDNILIPNGKVAFKINGKTIGHTNIKFGTAYFNYSIPKEYALKDYKLSVVYGGSSRFLKAQQNATLTLNKLNTKTDVKTEIVNSTLKININPVDENNNTVSRGKVCVKINGKTQKTYTINGKSTYNFIIPKSWNNHDVKVLVIYGENSKYNTSRTEITTKITLPTVKSVKKEDVVNNYYVSAENGLDTNAGTINNPFKTIQKAITTVQNNKQTANVYLTGNFKGAGNTNLTVPGDLRINFIGVGNSSIDGEVNYTYHISEGDDYYWGSSSLWEPYDNGKGNWAMNITKGKGLITVSNLTIKNCWNPGTSSISGYKTATLDNYGNLEVNNVSFIFNHGGLGASIRNNNGSTLKVLNSFFEANRKSSSTGNFGAGIYNNATAVVINSTFQNNYARWGTITNDKNLTIINSTIRDNIGYDGGSSYKSGPAIVSNTGGADFYNQYEVLGLITIINGCTFTNNSQNDIYIDGGIVNITNNVFNKSTGIIVNPQKDNSTFNIINNTFDSPAPSTLYTSLSSKNPVLFVMKLSGTYNYTVDSNKVINMIGTSSQALEFAGHNSKITNNTFTRNIYVSGENNTITGNNITTNMDEYTILLSSYSKNNTVADNYLESTLYLGNSAVNYTSITNKVENNTPAVRELKVDEESFYKYFDDDGNLLSSYETIEQLQIVGALNNKNINLKNNLSIIQSGNFISYNLTINTTAKLDINSVRIINTNQKPVLTLADDGVISRVNFTTNNNNTIVVNGKNNTIENNTLVADLLVGDESVKTTNTNNIVNQNMPIYKNYILTQQNFNTYFNDDGTIKPLESPDIHFIVDGTITNKDIILNNNKPVTITNYNNAKLVNVTVKAVGETPLNMTHITIENTNKKALELNTPTNIIMYNNITSNSNIITANTKNITINFNNISLNLKDTNAINIANASDINITQNNIIANVEGNVSLINIENVIRSSSKQSYTEDANITYNNITIQNNKESTPVVISVINKKAQARIGVIYNNIVLNTTNSKAVYIENQRPYIAFNNINLLAKHSTAIQVINTTIDTNQYEPRIACGNTINFENTDTTGIITQGSDGGRIYENNFNVNYDNATAILISKQTKNVNITKNNFNINSDSKAIIIKDSTTQLIDSNSISAAAQKIMNDEIITLDNAQRTTINRNSIRTFTNHTIMISKTSKKSKITQNTLFSSSDVGDDSVLNLNPADNRVENNLPNPVSYFYLNEKTYNEYFNTNGTIKDELPSSITIITTGDLYNKVLNITKPVNIITTGITFHNVTLIISENAKGANFTGANFVGETRIEINANDTNVAFESIKNEVTTNTSLITINGNNNTVNIAQLEPTTNLENQNIILVTITGDNNNLKIPSLIQSSKFNNVLGVYLNNSNNNNINVQGFWLRGKNQTAILLNNSNNNTLNIQQIDFFATIDNEGLKLTNSSYNKIALRNVASNYGNPYTSMLKLEENSNYNQFNGNVNIKGKEKTPVYIINSHYNKFYNGNITSTSSGYVMNITEGVGNKVEFNTLSSANLIGDDCVIQENANETINNIVRFNTPGISTYNTRINITIPSSAKVYDTIKINISLEYKNGTSWNSPYILIDEGILQFKINDKEVALVNITNGLAEIEHTITAEDRNILIVDVSYIDPNNIYQKQAVSRSINVIKLNTNTFMPNTTNNGITTTITNVILDEKGNIVYDGNVTFILENETQTVAISNGIAQATFNTGNFKPGEYNITATFNGNNICNSVENMATLTVIPYDAYITVNSVTTLSGNKVLLTANVTDINGNPVNTGRVVFKLNGCTLKDANGNALIANVKDGIATVEYTIPASYTAKNYTLTAVASSSTYNRTESNTTLTINKTTPKAQQIPTTVKRTNNTTITVKFTDNKNNNLIGENKVCIKFNGKTIINTKATNGTVNVNLDLTNYKNKEYELTVICGENNRYNTCKNVSTLILE